jgi:hypothetical protein
MINALKRLCVLKELFREFEYKRLIDLFYQKKTKSMRGTWVKKPTFSLSKYMSFSAIA